MRVYFDKQYILKFFFCRIMLYIDEEKQITIYKIMQKFTIKKEGFY
ncbi:hypothetical protein PIPA1_42590 [Pelosinus sp. IPA-1]|nr:hypothetical protein PIPA1_42590 [Pelosinus sp. IPA-1]